MMQNEIVCAGKKWICIPETCYGHGIGTLMSVSNNWWLSSKYWKFTDFYFQTEWGGRENNAILAHLPFDNYGSVLYRMEGNKTLQKIADYLKYNPILHQKHFLELQESVLQQYLFRKYIQSLNENDEIKKMLLTDIQRYLEERNISVTYSSNIHQVELDITDEEISNYLRKIQREVKM